MAWKFKSLNFIVLSIITGEKLTDFNFIEAHSNMLDAENGINWTLDSCIHGHHILYLKMCGHQNFRSAYQYNYYAVGNIFGHMLYQISTIIMSSMCMNTEGL